MSTPPPYDASGPADPHPQHGWGPPPGYPPYGPAGYHRPPDHPRATTALVLGILSLAVCGLVGPFAWSVGGRTVREIDASGGRLGGRTQAQIGYVLGIVGTLLLVLPVGFLVLFGLGIGGMGILSR